MIQKRLATIALDVSSFCLILLLASESLTIFFLFFFLHQWWACNFWFAFDNCTPKFLDLTLMVFSLKKKKKLSYQLVIWYFNFLFSFYFLKIEKDRKIEKGRKWCPLWNWQAGRQAARDSKTHRHKQKN